MFNFFLKKQKTISSAAIILSIFTLLAQILAVIKNKLFSIYFGANENLDLFFSAFKIPDIIFLLIGTIAAGTILIPIFTEKENQSKKEENLFMSKFFNSFSLFLIIITGIIWFFIPTILNLFFTQYSQKSFNLLVTLTRLLLLSPILMGIANFFISINQKNKLFLPMAITGVLYNLGIIFGTIFLSKKFGIYGLVYGVLIGASFYLLIQLITIWKHKLFQWKIYFLNKKEIFDIFKITLPRSIALSISSFVLVYFYSRISDLKTDGLITIFTFAYNIFWIPVTLLNQSYSGSSLPVLAKYYVEKKYTDFNNLIKKIINQIMFFAIPFAIFIAGFSNLIVAILFGSKKFNLQEINSTGIILSVFAFLIVFQILLLFISRIFYSMGKTKEVMYANIFGGCLIVLLSYLSNIFNINFNIDINSNFIKNFNALFKYSLIFVISYSLTSIFIFWELKQKIPKINLFNWKMNLKKLYISIISLIILKEMWRFFNLQINLSDFANIQKIIWTGIWYFSLIFIFSYIFKEEDFMNFYSKIGTSLAKKHKTVKIASNDKA